MLQFQRLRSPQGSHLQGLPAASSVGRWQGKCGVGKTEGDQRGLLWDSSFSPRTRVEPGDLLTSKAPPPPLQSSLGDLVSNHGPWGSHSDHCVLTRDFKAGDHSPTLGRKEASRRELSVPCGLRPEDGDRAWQIQDQGPAGPGSVITEEKPGHRDTEWEPRSPSAGGRAADCTGASPRARCLGRREEPRVPAIG